MSAQSPTGHPATAAGPRPARQPLAQRSPTNRSRVSNGADVLPNIDGRSAEARRIYDLIANICSDLGGADRISETRLSLVRRFASLAVLAEEQEARLARGEEVDVVSLAHLSSTLCRLASRIGLKRTPREVILDPLDYARTHEDVAS